MCRGVYCKGRPSIEADGVQISVEREKRPTCLACATWQICSEASQLIMRIYVHSLEEAVESWNFTDTMYVQFWQRW
jgi:hypothetical protein